MILVLKLVMSVMNDFDIQIGISSMRKNIADDLIVIFNQFKLEIL